MGSLSLLYCFFNSAAESYLGSVRRTAQRNQNLAWQMVAAAYMSRAVNFFYSVAVAVSCSISRIPKEFVIFLFNLLMFFDISFILN